jgi:hypothetical protein
VGTFAVRPVAGEYSRAGAAFLSAARELGTTEQALAAANMVKMIPRVTNRVIMGKPRVSSPIAVAVELLWSWTWTFILSNRRVGLI